MTRQYDNYADLITFSRSSGGTALRPVSYGDELVTNGTFDSDTGWTKGTGWSISGGTANKAAGAGDAIYQSASLVVGRILKITYTVSGRTAGICAAALIGGTQVTGNLIGDNGARTEYLVVGAGNTSVGITANNTFDGSIDNISVKEVLFDQPNAPLTLFNHPAGIPRIEYDADGNRLGLLIEEARTNEIKYSQDFDNADWTKTRCTITANQALAPDGTQTADLMTATGNDARLQDDIINSTAFVTQSVWVKSATGGDVAGQLDFAGLDTQTFTASGEWQRIHTTSTNLSFSDLIRIRITNSGDSLYVWGAQLEQGAFPTSYIPTSGATATRAADVASIATSEFGYRDDEGTVVVEGSFNGNDSNSRMWELSDGTSSNFATIYKNGATSLSSYMNAGGALQTSGTVVSGGSAGTFYKIAFAFAPNDAAFTADGNAPAVDASVIVPEVDSLFIGQRGNVNFFYLNGHIRSIKYIPRRLTNSQLVELTT